MELNIVGAPPVVRFHPSKDRLDTYDQVALRFGYPTTQHIIVVFETVILRQVNGTFSGLDRHPG